MNAIKEKLKNYASKHDEQFVEGTKARSFLQSATAKQTNAIMTVVYAVLSLAHAMHNTSTLNNQRVHNSPEEVPLVAEKTQAEQTVQEEVPLVAEKNQTVEDFATLYIQLTDENKEAYLDASTVYGKPLSDEAAISKIKSLLATQ